MPAPVSKTWRVLDFNTSLSWYEESGLFTSNSMSVREQPWQEQHDGEMHEWPVAQGTVVFKAARRGYSFSLEERPSAVFEHPNLVPMRRCNQKMPRSSARQLESSTNMEPEAGQLSSLLYSYERVLGEGTYATVWLARRKAEPFDLVAVKVAKYCSHGGRSQAVSNVAKEFKALSMFGAHDGVVNAHQCLLSTTPFEAVMVLELCEQTLEHALRGVNFILECPTKRCQLATGLHTSDALAQITCAVGALHEANILHRDIKPGNLLVRKKDHVTTICLSDFGDACSTSAATSDKHLVTTALYRSPEVFMGGHHTNHSDMWSVGCVAAEVVGWKQASHWQGSPVMFAGHGTDADIFARTLAVAAKPGIQPDIKVLCTAVRAKSSDIATVLVQWKQHHIPQVTEFWFAENHHLFRQLLVVGHRPAAADCLRVCRRCWCHLSLTCCSVSHPN